MTAPIRIQRQRVTYDPARNRAWRNSASRPRAKCHPHKFHRARGLCDACYDRWLYANSPKHKSQRKLSAQGWSAKYVERKASSNQKARLKRRYGLSLEQYQKMFDEQAGTCLLCKRSDLKLAIDHYHETGRVRGLLCLPCNGSLGWIERISREKDSPWFAAALAYLEPPKCQ